MRLLLLPGTYDFKNLGDLAMLQVAVERLARAFPGSALRVLTHDAEVLERACPGAQAVPPQAWERWRKAKLLSRRACREGEAGFRRRFPGLFVGLLRLKISVVRGKYLAHRDFLDEIWQAGALILTGCGMINDCFRENSLHALELLQTAVNRGIHTALLGQGIGPLEDPLLRKRAAQVLPRVNSILIREERVSRPLLEDLGVSSSRIAFTGDDAVEPAWAARQESPGTELGFNLRLAPYSDVSNETVTAMRSALAAQARKRGVALLGIPITRGDIDCDIKTADQILNGLGVPGDSGSDVQTPLKAIQRTAACRVVVTGSYHLAVFALSQGIPAVCIASNQYYANKFLGLADAFGTGCTVLQAGAPGFENALANAIDQHWQQASALRDPLRQSAERQVYLANSACQKLFEQFRPASPRIAPAVQPIATAS